jgi:putative glycerol-1-phosphate prenyltransferase
MIKNHAIYGRICEAKSNNKKLFAILIDPDKIGKSNVNSLVKLAQDSGVDLFLVGGSLVVNDILDELISLIKSACDIPVILFPGSSRQLSYKADALLFLSLISGRNADLLIGKHVESAPFLKKSPLEIISTGYMLIDGGIPTSVSYMSNSNPIPATKDDIAACTAMAAELLGMKMIYMDAGSGALNPISASMISTVSNAIDIPLIVGGGIRTAEAAQRAVLSGADMVVVGNAIEKDPFLIKELSDAIHL